MNFLLSAAIRFFEILFAAGILGSAIVIILSAVEDVRTLVSKDHEEPGEAAWPTQL